MTSQALLLFARCAGFVSRAPGIAYPGVPPMLRACLAVALTIVLLPRARHGTSADGVTLVAGIALEFLIGSAMGIGTAVLYDGAYAGGRAIDDYVGVKAIAPSLQIVAPSGFGRVWSLALTGAFFLLGAYRPFILAFSSAFERMPLGSIPGANSWTSYAAQVATTVFRVALGVAGPAIAASFLVQVSLGALSRTIPRFGSLTLAFPLLFGVSLVAVALCVSVFALRSAPIVIAP